MGCFRSKPIPPPPLTDTQKRGDKYTSYWVEQSLRPPKFGVLNMINPKQTPYLIKYGVQRIDKKLNCVVFYRDSNRWYKILKRSSFREIEFTIDSIKSARIWKKILKQCHRTKKLSLIFMNTKVQPVSFIIQALSYLTYLRDLHLSITDVPETKQSPQVYQKNPMMQLALLKRLSINIGILHHEQSYQCLFRTYKPLRRFTNLEELAIKFSPNPFHYTPSLIEVSTIPNLKKLQLCLYESELQLPTKLIQSMKNLRSITLAGVFSKSLYPTLRAITDAKDINNVDLSQIEFNLNTQLYNNFVIQQYPDKIKQLSLSVHTANIDWVNYIIDEVVISLKDLRLKIVDQAEESKYKILGEKINRSKFLEKFGMSCMNSRVATIMINEVKEMPRMRSIMLDLEEDLLIRELNRKWHLFPDLISLQISIRSKLNLGILEGLNQVLHNIPGLENLAFKTLSNDIFKNTDFLQGIQAGSSLKTLDINIETQSQNRQSVDILVSNVAYSVAKLPELKTLKLKIFGNIFMSQQAFDQLYKAILNARDCLEVLKLNLPISNDTFFKFYQMLWIMLQETKLRECQFQGAENINKKNFGWSIFNRILSRLLRLRSLDRVLLKTQFEQIEQDSYSQQKVKKTVNKVKKIMKVKFKF